MRSILFILFTIILFGTVHSCKIEGCTNEDAANYNSKANSNDGSCLFKGDATFWVDTTFHFVDISIIIDDSLIGVIDGYFTEKPECGLPRSVNVRFEEGIYEFTALDTLGGTYTDTFYVERNRCTAKKIILDSLQ